MPDLSILKDIDFTDIGTLIFFAIFLIIAIIVLLILLAVAARIIKIIKRIIIKILNLDVGKPKFNQKDTEWLHKQEISEEPSDARSSTLKPRIAGADNIINDFKSGAGKEEKKQDAAKSYNVKEEEAVSEVLEKPKDEHVEEKETLESKTPAKNLDRDGNDKGSTVMPGKNSAGPVLTKSAEGKKEQSEKSYKEKSVSVKDYDEAQKEQGISESLEKLKAKHAEEGETLESKMPSRTENKGNEDLQEIKIPVPKRFQGETENQPKDQLQAVTREDEQQSIKAPVLSHKSALRIKNLAVAQNNIGTVSIPKQKPVTGGVLDSSIFEGQAEISRTRLETKLEDDPRVWKTAAAEGLNLTPIERGKLVKEVFAPTLGQNISRSDLKFGIKKLNEKLMSAKNPTEHAKIRKEIKFFKKIGGIR